MQSRLKRSAFSSAKIPCFAACIPAPKKLAFVSVLPSALAPPIAATGAGAGCGGLPVSLIVSPGRLVETLYWPPPSFCTSTSDELSSSTLGRNRGSLSRSEEHTSELQSPYDLVCRLLLEK